MGRKKKTITPRSRKFSDAPTTVEAAPSDADENPRTENGISTGNDDNNHVQAGAKINPSVVVSGVSSYPGLKVECEKALMSLRRGNYTKSLRLMKESCSRHENSALIHRVQGTVFVKVASIIDDRNMKIRHLRNAIDSARKAVELSPNSVEFGHFYANLLYEAANDGKEYEEVVHECQRALAIENPVDPAKESLQDESQQKISTPEARIAHVHDELRSLIQKCNIASLSTWMKNLGQGEEKFRLIPISRISEDPMESRLLQAKRPNEIKKVNKTPEERRKEIEVKVAAARILQRKSESPQLEKEGKGSNRGPESSGSGQRGGERRKNGRKSGSTGERWGLVRSYWNSVSLESKMDLVKVKINDLKMHFCSSKDGLENKVVEEALSFYEVNKTWKHWICCRCNKKLDHSESHMQHVVQEHMGNLLPKLQLVLPQNVDNEWIDMLLNFPWKPLDLSVAVKMVLDQQKCQDVELQELCAGSNSKDREECFKDARDSSLEKEDHGDRYNCSIGESNGCEKSMSDGDQESVPVPPPDGWLISDDPERAKLLGKIHVAFELLIRHKYLAASHVNKVMQFALDELQHLASGFQLLKRGLEQSPTCICFLGALQLRKILKFLQDLSQACGLSKYSDSNMPVDNSNGCSQRAEGIKVIFNPESLSLFLDEKLLFTEFAQEMSIGPALDNGVAAYHGDLPNGGNALTADGFLSWIFTGSSSREQVALWMDTKEKRTHQGLEIMQILEKELSHLQSLCESKCEHLRYEEALQVVEELCLVEGKKRECVSELTHQSYESVLKNRREQLMESDGDSPSISSRFELDALANVLKEAESLDANRFGYVEPYAGMSSQLRNLESVEAGEWRITDSFCYSDSFIEGGIQKQKEQLSAQLSNIDAQIMQTTTGIQQLELKLGSVSAYDYQSVLLPLVKSYMRAHLEGLTEKDAMEKSDAAREAFLAELDLDSKKDVRGRNDNSKYLQEKSKDKKKNRDNRKPKHSKVTSGSGPQFNPEFFAQSSFLDASDVNHSNSEVAIPADVDNLKEEETFQWRIELEEEERKLDETLEHQRKIDNEAKQKHLTEQHKISNCMRLKFKEGGLDVDSSANTGEQKEHKPAKSCSQKNGVMNNLEGIAVNTLNVDLLSIEAFAVSESGKAQHGKAQPVTVMANGGAVESVICPSNQQSGKRSRRRKLSNKTPDLFCQVMPAEKENREAQLSVVDYQRLNENLAGDGEGIGTKTPRQLQAEEEEERRFQADLEKAVRQSLDTYQEPFSLRMLQKTALDVLDSAALQPNVVTNEIDDESGTNRLGTGLQNEVGEYNCFLNVIIQSLWHLDRFRVEFLARSTLEHHHVGDPCVVCALYEIFSALSLASAEGRRKPVAPTTLRVALSNLYPDSNFFQEAQMNDASEVLEVIFDCLHRAFAPSSKFSDTDSVESNCNGSWDCANKTCIVHSLFGMDLYEQMNCYSCGLESRQLKYTSFFHNINASALRTIKVMCAECPFDELVNLIEMNHQLACDRETGGCGSLNYIHHILSTPPPVFTTVLGWQKARETPDDIGATLEALSTDIDISHLYRGIDPKNTYSLVSMVCYYGQHYHCFAYSHDHARWIMYDDKTVKEIGSWKEVISMCKRGHLQPQVLFFKKL